MLGERILRSRISIGTVCVRKKTRKVALLNVGSSTNRSDVSTTRK